MPELTPLDTSDPAGIIFCGGRLDGYGAIAWRDTGDPIMQPSNVSTSTKRSGYVIMRRVYGYFQRRFAPERVKLFYEIFDINENTKVVDLGGTPTFWNLAQSQGRPMPRVTILNILPLAGQISPCQAAVIGDAKEAPFDDLSFDIAFSNSLVEHLFSWDYQRIFADEVRRLAPNYFVQTPDKFFPVEPHFMTPFVHWLPKPVRRRAIRNFTVWGVLERPSPKSVDAVVAEIRLLSQPEMAILFPEAELKSEKFMGFSKSIVAYRRQAI